MKVWEQLQPDLSTNPEKFATWRGVPLMTSTGPCAVSSLVGAAIH